MDQWGKLVGLVKEFSRKWLKKHGFKEEIF